MGGGIVIGFGPVAGPRQDRAVRPDHHGTHRHLSARGGGAGLFQRDFHG
jgi:hypothetical protein